MIDWRIAPDGATHFCEDNHCWYKLCSGEPSQYWNPSGKKWALSDYSHNQVIGFRKVSARPALNPVEQPPQGHTAADYCQAAMGHMVDRATTYDAPAGERSMAKTVAAFNALTGHQLTEEQGWLFMETLKMARSQQGEFKRDNYEDAVAYAALRGEAAEKERNSDQA